MRLTAILAAAAAALCLSACSAPEPFGDGGPIALDQAVRGALEADDERLETGEHTAVWTFTAAAGERYLATLESADFDSYLIVRGAGVSLENDDSGRANRDSLVDFIAPENGEVSITVTSYGAGETGDYRLRVRRIRDQGEPRPQSLRLGRSQTGALEAGGARRESGQYVAVHEFQGVSGEVVDIRLTSDDFDPYLEISGPDGFADANDDDPENDLNSRLVTALPADGTYRITVTSYAPGQIGRYQLTAARADAATAAEWSTGMEAAAGSRLSVGDTIRGALAEGDEQLASGEYVDGYRFIGSRGQRVRIDATSTDFDTYLILTLPDGSQRENDDGPDGTDARMDEVLPADGEYGIRVTSYEPEETGTYRLSLSAGQESARQQGVQAGQRVFAVMVGVSDYGGASSNLPYTDEDAVNLEAELRRQGVLNPASVLLTNAQATRASVTSAIQRVAAQAGPEDVFLFFFSGHGVQHPTTSDRELDGQSEHLVLRDGEISDVELARMLGNVRARLSLVVLDACFSGGFAREVVSRPGVMGVFSSEEDLTSMVADRFQAGGYLSHFLRTGLAGRADENGDRLVTAGELATYLRRQFRSEVHGVEAETSDGQRNYQNLVIDRGGVQVDDVVIRLAGG